jgi:adenosylhomocysteine nucleosidase
MYEEVADLVNLLEDITLAERGMRIYYQGRIKDIEVIVVFSRWGKVAAAATAVHLIMEYKVTELFFTGMSGAISADLKVGDIVVADKLYQYDMDATPLYHRFEIPMLGQTFLRADSDRVELAEQALLQSLEYRSSIPGMRSEMLAGFGIVTPRVYVGAIASGDKFFTDDQEKVALSEVLPDVLVVEMEGAAVAQVCHEYKLPYTIVRTVSDVAGANSDQSFTEFAQRMAGPYSVFIIKSLLGLHPQAVVSIEQN